MSTKNSPTLNSNRASIWQNISLSVALFLLALAPRMVGLQQFVTADEAKWVYRSAQFWLAVQQSDWTNTVVKLKPAVTTMWSAGPGFWLYNRFHQNLPFADFLAAIPEWQVEPAMLHAVRLPTILLTCASIVLCYLLLQPVLGRWPSFLAGFLLAFNPLFLAHSRFLHHDAMVTLFALPALILAIRAAKDTGWLMLVASAVLAGLAFLTKSPILFLAPFVAGLFGVTAWQVGRQHGQIRQKILTALARFAVWGCVAYITFVVVWPAAWFRPVGLPLDVVLDALREAAPKSDDTSINLGILYYPVYFLFYTTLPVLAGLVVWGFQHKYLSGPAKHTTQALAWFALTFILFMTLSDKRSARYILPAMVAVDVVAAAGWVAWLSRRKLVLGAAATVFIVGVQLLAVIPYVPYYITYTNPFVGGPFTAPNFIKVGWGEGMDQVGEWLNAQPNAHLNRAGADYASTLSPYFDGYVTSPTAQNLDYVVSYIKQRQSDSPPSEILAYYDEVVGPSATFMLAGIDYARVYPGPAAQLVDSGPVLAFRPHAQFAPIGQIFTVDLIGSTKDGNLSLQNGHSVGADVDKILSIDGVSVTRYNFVLPTDVPPGNYTLVFNDQPLGQVEARYAQPPSRFEPVVVDFGDSMQLVGFNPEAVVDDERLTVELAFRAAPKTWNNYTIFVHWVDEDGQRLAGHDAQPEPQTSAWFKEEVVLTRHHLELPPELSPRSPYRILVGLYRADTGEALGSSYLLQLR